MDLCLVKGGNLQQSQVNMREPASSRDLPNLHYCGTGLPWKFRTLGDQMSRVSQDGGGSLFAKSTAVPRIVNHQSKVQV